MARTLTLDQLKEAALAINATLLSRHVGCANDTYEYKHNSCGHFFNARHSNVKQGKGCPPCGRKRSVKARCLKHTNVVKVAEAAGFEPVSKADYRAREIREYRCIAKDHIVERSHNALQSMKGCPVCLGSPTKVTRERFKEAIGERQLAIQGFTEIKGCLFANISCIDCGHCFSATLHQLLKGGCKQCGIKRSAIKQRLPIEERDKIAAEQDLALLDRNSVSSKERVLYKCLKRGHVFSISHNLVKRGNGCTECANFNLVNESLCRCVFEALFGDNFSKSTPKWLIYKSRQLELDGFSEKLGIAFEHQGGQHYKFVKMYHGTEAKFEDLKARDAAKKRLCAKHGITLIVVRDLVKKGTKHQKIELIIGEIKREIPNFKVNERKLEDLKLMYTGEHRLETVEKLFKASGIELTNKEYLGMAVKHLTRCLACGHEWEVAPDKIKQGRGCPPCAGVKTYTIEDVRKVGKERGLECLSSKYVKYSTLLKWKCLSGHEFQATFASVRGESGRKPLSCPGCKSLIKKPDNPALIKEAKSFAKNYRGKCLSSGCKTTASKIDFECEHGHRFVISLNKLRAGQWCFRKCAGCRRDVWNNSYSNLKYR